MSLDDIVQLTITPTPCSTNPACRLPNGHTGKCRTKPKIDPETIERNTWAARHEADRLTKLVLSFVADEKRKTRVEIQKCRRCFYLRYGRISGQAFTTSPCKLCGVAVQYPTTHCDELCLDCAQQNAVCKECCADIDLREKRRHLPVRTRRKK